MDGKNFKLRTLLCYYIIKWDDSLHFESVKSHPRFLDWGGNTEKTSE